MAIRRPPTTFSDTISTADIADDAITGGKLANDIAISTTGNIATTGSGTLTVAGNTTLSGTNNLGSNPTITLGSNATGFAGIKEADQWRLTTNHTGSGGDLTSNFERTDDLGYGQIGTGMTESSGIFTFPNTGIWLVNVIAQYNSTSGGITYAGIRIYTTHNAGSGDTYDITTINYANMDSTGYYQSCSSSFQFDVTNVTTHKMKFHAEKVSSSATLQGNSTYNMTTFTFTRLGDT